MSKTLLLTLALFAFLAIVATALKGAKRSNSKDFDLKAKRPLTPFEEQMFFRLREALPEHIVLAQVSFSALVTSKREHRNYFDRKYADFVLCDQKLTPLVVVELDDPSHKSKQTKDAERDAMLTKAGYRTIRYKAIPPAATVKLDIEALTTPRHGTF